MSLRSRRRATDPNGESRPDDQRPSPEALLEAARREEGRTGKLKIFVGAAPGVGKTYEMLQQARAARTTATTSSSASSRRTGARKPRPCSRASKSSRASAWNIGQWLDEMDIDAVIARRPQIVLVDELAHTNAPGSRHPKRYLDVEELLDHGINVYSPSTSSISRA